MYYSPCLAKTNEPPSPPTAALHSLLSELDPAAAKWYNLGLALGVNHGRLDAIQADYDTVADRLREMLKAYLSNADQPTWKGVAAALESTTVGMGSLARSINERHCVVVDAVPRHRGKPN